MVKQISITIDDLNLDYLDRHVSNRSRYINKLIEQDRRSTFEASMREGYITQSQNPEIQAEDRLWEVTIADGIKDAD